MFANIGIDTAEVSAENSIKNVATVLDKSGKKATVKFAYPRSNTYTYCFIYDITDEEWNEGISLESLIEEERSVDIIDMRTPHDHVVELSRSGVRCMLFLARYDADKRTYYLIDQKKENITGQLCALPTVRCTVSYEGLKTGIFKLTSSKQKKAIIQIGGEDPIPGSYLVYRCVGSGRENKKFGIDMHAFRNKKLEIVIHKEEKIEVLPSPENKYLLQL